VRRVLRFRTDCRNEEVAVEIREGNVEAEIGGRALRFNLSPMRDGTCLARFESGRILRGRLTGSGDRFVFRSGGREIRIELLDPRESSAAPPVPASRSEVVATIPGRVVSVGVKRSDRVEAGQLLLVLEAMKMQNEIRAETAATVARIECSPGQAVEAGAVLIRFEMP